MKICDNCHTVWSEDELTTVSDDLGMPAQLVSGRTVPEEYEICPHCKSEELEEAVECCFCGEFTPLCTSDSLGSEYACKKCSDEIMQRFYAQFDDNEQALILEREC